MSPNIVIIGSALSGNKGAAAMLETAVGLLGERLPEARFTLLSMYPSEDRAQNRDLRLTVVSAPPVQLGALVNPLAVLHRLLPPLRPAIERGSPAVRALAAADLVLDQGGITFTDGREKFLLYNVASILPALVLGVPVIKVAQAIGPFERWANRTVARAVLPRVHTIVSRGEATRAFAEGIGLRNVVPGADLAFLLPVSTADEAQAVELTGELRDVDPSDVVGVCPSVVMARRVDAAGGDYVDEMARFIDSLAAEGHRVLLIAHSARGSTTRTHNNDLPLCREIHARLRHGSRVTFIDDELASQVLRAVVGRCDVLVTSRFHAMVSALAMQVPPLVVGWSHKYDEVLAPFGLDDWSLTADELSADALRRRFDELWSARHGVRNQIADRLPDVRARSRKQIELIAGLLEVSAG